MPSALYEMDKVEKVPATSQKIIPQTNKTIPPERKPIGSFN